LISDCEDLKAQKYYSYCILNLAQAFEMFFALYLRVQFLYKPYASERPDSLDKFNNCVTLLFDATRKYTYTKMRNIFLNLIVRGANYRSLAESESGISALNADTNEPSDDDIRAIQHSDMREVLLRLKKCKVSELRNDVVHKVGYRPNISEVELALDETASILHRLNRLLGQPMDDIYFHTANSSTP
jgi:hypothetical protein